MNASKANVTKYLWRTLTQNKKWFSNVFLLFIFKCTIFFLIELIRWIFDRLCVARKKKNNVREIAWRQLETILLNRHWYIVIMLCLVADLLSAHRKHWTICVANTSCKGETRYYLRYALFCVSQSLELRFMFRRNKNETPDYLRLVIQMLDFL